MGTSQKMCLLKPTQSLYNFLLPARKNFWNLLFVSTILMTVSRIKINSIWQFTWTRFQQDNDMIIKLKTKTTQNTTGSSASVQTSRTILNIVKRDTNWTRPFHDGFTLRASRLDSSSWRVRVQVSGEKLVDQTTEMILWSMILNFIQFQPDICRLVTGRKRGIFQLQMKWFNDALKCRFTLNTIKTKWPNKVQNVVKEFR